MTPNPFYISRDEAGIVLLSLALTAICIYAPCRWNYQKIPPPSYAEVRRLSALPLPGIYCSTSFSALQELSLLRIYSGARWLRSLFKLCWAGRQCPFLCSHHSADHIAHHGRNFRLRAKKKRLFLVTVLYFVTASFILLLGSTVAAFGVILALWYVARINPPSGARILEAACCRNPSSDGCRGGQ